MTDTKHTILPPFLGKAIAMEAGVWRSLFRWVARRPRVPAGAQAFGYAAPVMPIMFVFIGLSAIEIPILDLILSRWPIIRIVGLLVSLWGLTFMLGLLAGLKVHPHAVGDTGLRIRYGTTLDVSIPWDAIETVAGERHGLPESKTIQLTKQEGGSILYVGILSETNVNVTLRRPMTVPLPKGDESITAIHFYAEDSPALVAKARECLAADGATGEKLRP